MNPQIMASTCALIISVYGATPAVAESFNDRSWDWTMDSPISTAAYASNPQMRPRDGALANSWGGGKTPTQYEGPSSSSGRLATEQSCDPTPRVGFNQTTAFPTC
jgi:hypothetical protein